MHAHKHRQAVHTRHPTVHESLLHYISSVSQSSTHRQTQRGIQSIIYQVVHGICRISRTRDPTVATRRATRGPGYAMAENGRSSARRRPEQRPRWRNDHRPPIQDHHIHHCRFQRAVAGRHAGVDRASTAVPAA